MNNNVLKLTVKEEEVMVQFWERGAMFVRELLAHYDDPKPHFNTLSTIVRGLEEKGFIGHKSFGSTYQYFATISQEEFKAQSLKSLIGKYYDNSVFSAVSALVESKGITASELRELLDLVERGE